MAHVKGTGEHVYPTQDADDLRAQSLEVLRERLYVAAKRWRDATERRVRLTYDRTCTEELFDRASRAECLAGTGFEVLLSETFRGIKMDMERAGVPVVHEVRP
uniref:Uncharacterized protein n=1 Tax=viral metagenome TaxID=1070528 RepID=A0A6M3K9A9_9ZZZZ